MNLEPVGCDVHTLCVNCAACFVYLLLFVYKCLHISAVVDLWYLVTMDRLVVKWRLDFQEGLQTHNLRSAVNSPSNVSDSWNQYFYRESPCLSQKNNYL